MINSSDNIVINSHMIVFKDQLIDNTFSIVEYDNENNIYEVIYLAFFTEEYMDNKCLFQSAI